MKFVRVAGMALTGALMAVLAAVPAQADEAEVWASAWVGPRPLPQGGYGLIDSRASDGVTVSMTHVSTGTFTVHLDGGAHEDGVPMVAAVNAGPVHCQVASYGPDDDDEDIAVMCYNGTVLTNTGFNLSFFASEGDDELTGAYGYVRNNRPTATTTYSNPPSYNSTGGNVTISRPEAGIWTVHFAGAEFANSGGNVQVMPLGTLAARCAVVDWAAASTGVNVRVRCVNLRGSTPPQWILAYAHKRSLLGNLEGFFGYLQSEVPDPPINEVYTPNPDRNFAPNDVFHRVIRAETGRYDVQVYGPLKEPVGLHVSINDNVDGFCVITDVRVTPSQQPAARVKIDCYTAGRLANSKFTLNYYAP
jgi:hypothetical protein